ncbi:MAG: RDD family protein [Oscillibacter sp.]|nr:RDD family protein [Oscillibacter sp.]
MRDNVCYAGFAVRFFAWLVDMIVMFVPLAVLRSLKFAAALADPYAPLVRPVLFRYCPLDIALYLLPALYFVFMTWSQGATLGKMLLKLEVVSAESGRLTFWQIVLRETFGRYLSGALLMIGYFIMIPDREKRALHDIFSDTRVVYAVKPQTVRAVRPQAVAEDGGASGETPA